MWEERIKFNNEESVKTVGSRARILRYVSQIIITMFPSGEIAELLYFNLILLARAAYNKEVKCEEHSVVLNITGSVLELRLIINGKLNEQCIKCEMLLLLSMLLPFFVVNGVRLSAHIHGVDNNEWMPKCKDLGLNSETYTALASELLNDVKLKNTAMVVELAVLKGMFYHRPDTYYGNPSRFNYKIATKLLSIALFNTMKNIMPGKVRLARVNYRITNVNDIKYKLVIAVKRSDPSGYDSTHWQSVLNYTMLMHAAFIKQNGMMSFSIVELGYHNNNVKNTPGLFANINTPTKYSTVKAKCNGSTDKNVMRKTNLYKSDTLQSMRIFKHLCVGWNMGTIQNYCLKKRG